MTQQNNPTPNVALLKQTLAHIEAHPDEWQQTTYRCGTGMCFAGHAATLAGGAWMSSNPLDDYMVAEDADDPIQVLDKEIHVKHRAERVLGLAWHQADRLFAPGNDLDLLRLLVAEICENAEAAS
jgi:hypothetical protein